MIRITLAYGFYKLALNKWNDIDSVTSWFASMTYPLPKLYAHMASGTKLLVSYYLPLVLDLDLFLFL
ncbi:DoxX family membrane protein [Lentimicrobium sp. S6]|uniref:DoxX family membrane protein n=1 Tax=unclassified Lentimicrobium TaxID=2677434 RepID=UPI00352DB8AA